MGRMQIRGTNEAAPCLPSQFTLMMTNTFVHGEGRWELQYASNHCPPEISSILSFANPHLYLSFSFLPFNLYNKFSLSPTLSLKLWVIPFSFFFPLSIFLFILPLRDDSESHKAQLQQTWRWFARGQCYLNRPIGLFAIAPSIRQEALRNQPITSISHDSIQWIYNGRHRVRNEIRWKPRDGEKERDKEGEGLGGGQERKRWRASERSQSTGFSRGLCQWPLCGGVCCLFVVWDKQVIVESEEMDCDYVWQ